MFVCQGGIIRFVSIYSVLAIDDKPAIHSLPSATKLRRLCFYTCLSVILFTGGVCLSACWDITPREGSITSPHPGMKHPTPGKEAPPLEGSTPSPGKEALPRSTTPLGDSCRCGRYASYWNHSYLFEQHKQINSYKNIASEINAYSLIESTLFPIISMLGSFLSFQAILFACLTNWYNTPLLAVIIKYDFPID